MPHESVAQFTVESVQVLAEDGSVDEDPVPSLTDDQLLQLYEQMKRSRRLDEWAISLQRRGEIGTYVPAIGREAAQIGSAFAMADDDWIVPSFREQPALLVRATPPHEILLYALEMEKGAAIPEGEHALPPAISVGTQPLHAAGIGWGEALQGRSNAGVTHFGDGATSEGDVYEAFNFAGVYHTRTVFVCQNNQYAISTRLENQSDAETIARKAIAAGNRGDPRRRERRARRLPRRRGGHRERPRGGAGVDRGAHLPALDAYDLRRPLRLPRDRRGGVGGSRPDPPLPAVPRRVGDPRRGDDGRDRRTDRVETRRRDQPSEGGARGGRPGRHVPV